MVRSSNLKAFAVLAAFLMKAGPAYAETPIDWYVDLKREAKYARIASFRGALLKDVQQFDAAATRLVVRIDNWDTNASVLSKQLCLAAALNFLNALKKAGAEARHNAILDGEPQRDRCLASIQTR